MKILIIEPFFTGSHKDWANGYKKYSSHHVEILGMEGRYWKWRMHGGAVTLGRLFLEKGYKPDLIVSTDMLDLSIFLALTRERTAGIPTALYFHENQLTYPWSPGDRDLHHGRDGHYGFINYSSAMATDHVYFNSSYHMESFLSELGRFLNHFPDYNESETVDEIREKSAVLHLGLNLSRFEDHKPCESRKGKPPLILWNHRWEYDKNPADFFNALYAVMEMGIDFEVAILGETFRRSPKEFPEAKKRLGNRLVHYGYAKDFAEYAKWLWEADIMPVTSNQDFFGGSVVEGIFCNTWPLLPKRLAYPEHIPGESADEFFYDDFSDLTKRLIGAIENIDNVRSRDVSSFVKRYRWEETAAHYDRSFENLIKG